MKAYLISLTVGVVVGAFYGLLGVRSPAPPLIALIGLLGIVVGEQAIPLAKHLLAGGPPAVAWEKTDRAAKALGRLPGDTSTKPPGA
jgi:XapX domain-containing protein